MEISEILNKRRKEMGMSTYEVNKRSNGEFSHQYVLAIEKGTSIHLKKLTKYMEFLGLKLEISEK